MPRRNKSSPIYTPNTEEVVLVREYIFYVYRNYSVEYEGNTSENTSLADIDLPNHRDTPIMNLLI